MVAEGEHLIRKELREREEDRPMVAEQSKAANRVHGEERLRQKKKARVLVDGGVQEEMDIDE